jgi:hypothetical protein
MKRPSCGDDNQSGRDSATAVVFYLPLPDRVQHEQAAAGGVAALRTLQPHNHAKPKQSHKFPSLNPCARAAPQTSGGCVRTVDQAGHHDGLKAQRQMRHKC